MWEGHVDAIWKEYHQALDRLQAARHELRASSTPGDSSEIQSEKSLRVRLIEAEIRGTERFLDCFAAPMKIDAARQFHRLPDRPPCWERGCRAHHS